MFSYAASLSMVPSAHSHTSVFLLCPPVLSSIPDRVPEMDENWTFSIISSLYAKRGTQYRFILHYAFLNKSLRLELCWRFFTHVEGVLSVGNWMSEGRNKLWPERPLGVCL